MTLVSQNMKVLITSVNKPRVSAISGQVRMEIKGRSSAFTNPKISASQIMETSPLFRSIPGRIRIARYNAIALTAQRRINFVMDSPLCSYIALDGKSMFDHVTLLYEKISQI